MGEFIAERPRGGLPAGSVTIEDHIQSEENPCDEVEKSANDGQGEGPAQVELGAKTGEQFREVALLCGADDGSDQEEGG